MRQDHRPDGAFPWRNRRTPGPSSPGAVALTFTDKSARELRQRIRLRCRERLAQGESSARWRSVLRALEAAPIGTFHEFANRMLRAHAVELGVDPEFVILDETIAASLRDQAIRTAIRRMLSQRDQDLTLPATDYGLSQIREAVGVLLATRTAGDLEEWGEIEPSELVNRWRQVWDRAGKARLAPRRCSCRALLSRSAAGTRCRASEASGAACRAARAAVRAGSSDLLRLRTGAGSYPRPRGRPPRESNLARPRK